MGRHLKRIGHNLWLCFNMTVCAIVFFPIALPRETISGLVGRMNADGYRWRTWGRVESVINALYFWEKNHCAETARQERDARGALGYYNP